MFIGVDVYVGMMLMVFCCDVLVGVVWMILFVEVFGCCYVLDVCVMVGMIEVWLNLCNMVLGGCFFMVEFWYFDDVVFDELDVVLCVEFVCVVDEIGFGV